MKILFITSTRIGDAVLSTGLLDHLLRTYPQARVTIACGPQPLPLFAAVPNLDRAIPMAKGRWARHWISLWLTCVGTRWDIVVDLRKSAVSYLLRARKRYQLGGGTEPIHRVRQIADVLDLPEPPMPKIWTARSHGEAAARLIPPGPPVLAVGPTSNWRAKTWRPGNFVELAERLAGPAGILPGARIAVFGAGNERPHAQPVIDALPAGRCIDLVGSVDLLTAYACLERCDFYVGNDSALMHLAAASGIPTLGLFGPSPEVFYAPWSWNAAVVRTVEPFETIFPENFDHRNSDTLMDSLTPDMAEEAARDLWHRSMGVAA
ncbi:MAG: glycosyltransferase family 9 protein [Alphaproteobacteria bacterium]